MSKVLTICSESSGGKDCIFKRLLSLDLGLIPCVLHTTRPMRDGEQEGKEYYFITKEEFKRMEDNGELIEKREYNTIAGQWLYGLSKKSIDLSKGNHIVILDLEGLQALKQAIGSENVHSIYLEASPVTRLIRSIERQRQEIEREYVSNKEDSILSEIFRRFEDDKIKFAEHNSICDISLRNESKEDLDNAVSYTLGLL